MFLVKARVFICSSLFASKSFRIQNWLRVWHPQCKQSVNMAAIIGNLGPFDEKSEKFSDYSGRFEAYVAANDIDDDKKVNVFLAVIGPDAYNNPNTKTFTRLTQLLQGHYEPFLLVYQNSSLD